METIGTYQDPPKSGLWSTIPLILFGDLFLKGNHYEIKVYTFFSLVTSKPKYPLIEPLRPLIVGVSRE